MAVWYILYSLGNLKVIWYNFPVLVCCVKKNLATLHRKKYYLSLHKFESRCKGKKLGCRNCLAKRGRNQIVLAESKIVYEYFNSTKSLFGRLIRNKILTFLVRATLSFAKIPKSRM
jgi:hypothetical protein